MADTDTPSPRLCGHCSKPATLYCGNCFEAKDLVEKGIPVSYCSTECQLAHWSTHKTDCKALKYLRMLYNAGDVLNTLWPIMRAQSKLATVDKVEVDGATIKIWETSGVETWRHNGPLEEIHPDKHVARAVLDACELANVETICALNPLAVKLLKVSGVCSKVERRTVKPRGQLFTTTYHIRKDPGQEYKDVNTRAVEALLGLGFTLHDLVNQDLGSHCLFKVALKGSSKTFAVDVANAHHGRYDTVVPWKTYKAERVQQVTNKSPSESYSSIPRPSGEHMVRVVDLVEFNSFRMLHLVESWLVAQKLEYASFLQLGKSQFAGKLASLEHFATEGLRASFPEARKCGDLAMEMLGVKVLSDEWKNLDKQRDSIKERLGVLRASRGAIKPFSF